MHFSEACCFFFATEVFMCDLSLVRGAQVEAVDFIFRGKGRARDTRINMGRCFFLQEKGSGKRVSMYLP